MRVQGEAASRGAGVVTRRTRAGPAATSRSRHRRRRTAATAPAARAAAAAPGAAPELGAAAPEQAPPSARRSRRQRRPTTATARPRAGSRSRRQARRTRRKGDARTPASRDRDLRLRDDRQSATTSARSATRTGRTTMRPTKLPAFDDEFGKGGRTFLSVRQTRFGVKATAADRCRRHQDDVRVRAVRHRRRRGPDDVSSAPRLWRLEAAPRGPDVESVHGHRRVPELDRVLGPERHGVLPQRAARVDADPGRLARDGRARAAGRERRTPATTPSASSSRTSSPRFPAPDVSAEGRLGGAWGYVELAGIVRYITWDDLGTPRRPSSGHACGWGVNLSSNIKLGAGAAQAAGRVRPGDRELHERCRRRHRRQARPGDPGAADRRRGAAGARPGRVRRHRLERATHELGRLVVRVDRQLRRRRRPTRFTSGHYALGNLLVHPIERA